MCRSITSYNISCIKGFFLSGMKQALNTESAVMRYEKKNPIYQFENIKLFHGKLRRAGRQCLSTKL